MPMPQAARAAGVHQDTFKRRMLALNERHDGKLLEQRGRGKYKKWWVSPRALQLYLQGEEYLMSDRIAALESMGRIHGGKLEALHALMYDTRGRLRSLEGTSLAPKKSK